MIVDSVCPYPAQSLTTGNQIKPGKKIDHMVIVPISIDFAEVDIYNI
jgi:hypothetical protein